ncbi:MAG: trehalose-phosphatase [Candidatus Acidiferrum sp.]|jgi:trehalose 6-phosphate phosphatase
MKPSAPRARETSRKSVAENSRRIPDLFRDWDAVVAQLRKHHKVTVFLDFDGTLVNIAPRPELVKLPSAAKKILQRLARHPHVTLVVVSGRRRAELLEHIGVRGIHYFGLYGWESDAKSGLPEAALAALRQAQQHLKPLLGKYPAVWIEDKHSSLSVHLLDVPKASQRRVRRELFRLLTPFRKSLHAVENIRDVEILPRSIPGKGIAVSRFLRRPGYKHSFPFYFGDDYSDESGFVAARRGAPVQVGNPRPTRAKYHLRGPSDVLAALAKLEKSLSEQIARNRK